MQPKIDYRDLGAAFPLSPTELEGYLEQVLDLDLSLPDCCYNKDSDKGGIYMFTLPKLPYDYSALEPYIDAQTMIIHYTKHHQTYVDKLNTALEDTEWADKSIEEVLQNLNTIPEDRRTAVRNNGGGHYNHCLFWESMQPESEGLSSGKLYELIINSFGSFESFQQQFSDAAVGRFGSGWVWLLKDGAGLKITSTPNQDSPVMDGISSLLGLDVWEHAYYLKYQNRRPEYVENWWNVVNWTAVESRL